MKKIVVAGVGMTHFASPKLSKPYTDMAFAAIRQALSDAAIEYPDIQRVYAGYVYGDSTSGQRAVYGVGLTGIPIINVNNNCSTGSTALYLAREAVAGGQADCVLALGFEQMAPGALAELYRDRPSPVDPLLRVAQEKFGVSEGPIELQLF